MTLGLVLTIAWAVAVLIAVTVQLIRELREEE